MIARRLGNIWAEQDAHTILLLHCNDFTDSSMYHKTLVNTNCTIVDGKFGSGIQFGVSGARINIENGMYGIDYAGDFTFDWWEYAIATQSTGAALFINRIAQPSSSSDEQKKLLIAHQGTNLYASSVAGSFNMFSGAVIKDRPSSWNHYALVRSGTSWKSYKNGTLYWRGSTAYNPVSTDGYNMALGANVDPSAIYTDYKSKIDEFRISNIARWTENFTPPDQPYS